LSEKKVKKQSCFSSKLSFVFFDFFLIFFLGPKKFK